MGTDRFDVSAVSRRLRNPWTVIGLVLAVGVVMRFFRWTEPILDQHAFRQTQTAAPIWLWERDGFDFFNYHVPQFGGGHWVLELPVYQLVTYIFSLPFGAAEQAGRAVSVLSFIAAAILIFLIGRRLVGRAGAVAAVVLFAFLPINVFYYRAVLIDPFQIALTLLSVYALFRVYERFSYRWFAVFTVAIVLASLGKATIVFVLGWPLAVLTLRILLGRFQIGEKVALAGTWLVTGVLVVWWARHSDALNEASNGMTFAEERDWFFGSTFTDATLWSTVGQRLLDNLQIPGVLLVAIGLAAAFTVSTRYRLELLSLVVGAVAFVGVFANLNRIHDYYQLPLYVTLALFGGLGLATVLRALIPQDPQARMVIGAGALLAIGSLWTLTLFQSYYHPDSVNYGLLGQAIELKTNTPDELLLVASQPGDPNEPMHLYEARRKGWRIDSGDTAGINARLAESPEIGAIAFIQDPASVPAETVAAVGESGYAESYRSAGMLVFLPTSS